MKYIKKYKLFESVIYGQKDGFSNQDILTDVEDILLDLEDIGIECRIWTNNEREDMGIVSRINIPTNRLFRIDIEINYDNDDFAKKYEIKNTVKSVLTRLEDYFKGLGRIRITYEDEDFLELSINILNKKTKKI